MALALVGLVIGIALPLAAKSAASLKQSGSGSISSAHAREIPLSLNRWSSNGPDGGNVLSLAIDQSNPATIYAGTYGSDLFKSTNRGATWSSSLANSDATSTPVSAIISVADFQLAQQIVKENLRTSFRNAKHFYLLRSLVKCGCCGRSYIGLAAGNGAYHYSLTKHLA